MYFVESWTNKHSQPLYCAIRQQWLNHRACKTGILVSPIYNGCLFYTFKAVNTLNRFQHIQWNVWWHIVKCLVAYAVRCWIFSGTFASFYSEIVVSIYSEIFSGICSEMFVNKRCEMFLNVCNELLLTYIVTWLLTNGVICLLAYTVKCLLIRSTITIVVGRKLVLNLLSIISSTVLYAYAHAQVTLLIRMKGVIDEG